MDYKSNLHSHYSVLLGKESLQQVQHLAQKFLPAPLRVQRRRAACLPGLLLAPAEGIRRRPGNYRQHVRRDEDGGQRIDGY